MYFFIFMFVGTKSWSTLIMDSPVFLPLRYYSSSLIMVLFYILVLICVSCGMLWTCWLYPVPSLLSAWTCCKLGLLLFIVIVCKYLGHELKIEIIICRLSYFDTVHCNDKKTLTLRNKLPIAILKRACPCMVKELS